MSWVDNYFVAVVGLGMGEVVAAIVSVIFRVTHNRWPHWEWWILIPIGVAISALGIARGIEP